MGFITRQFDFKNKENQVLSGRIELPSEKPRAMAIMAHCFTCSKDSIAAARISRNLSELGIGVLRFDFTGLGNSEGEFANTNFSSNVQDLISAYEALTKEYQPPTILIGHSLGGAAVLKASLELDLVKAVVTIGAPSDTQHVKNFFESQVEKIKSEGKAEVNLAGRKFTIKKQLIDDLNEQTILVGLSHSKKAYLIMHSPTDNTVSIDSAARIFQAVKHPKSFISLDGTDHLLSKAKDAEYVSQVISAWVTKFIPDNKTTQPEIEGRIEVRSRKRQVFTQDIYSNQHHLVADEPLSANGEGLGMDPYELLLSSLGACTAMTIKMYANRKGILIDDLKVELNHEKKYSEDCESCEEKPQKLDHIEKKIYLSGNFTEEQRQRMIEISSRCPVHTTLKSEVNIKTISS